MKINEIFYSLQGEGCHAGRAGVFVRFSGCNLKCPFCDTDFRSFTEMSEDEIVEAVKATDEGDSKFVVITGGEPTLQLTNSLLQKLHTAGYYVAMESNGAYKNGEDFKLDWLTISPKNPFIDCPIDIKTRHADEVKLVVDERPGFNGIMAAFEDEIEADHYYLQPCDTGNQERNKTIIQTTIQLLKRNPKWRLSLQTQKLLGIR